MGGPGMGGPGGGRGRGRGGPGGGRGGGPPGSRRLASSLDADYEEELGKVYDSKVIARLPKYLIPVWKPLGIGALGMLITTVAHIATPLLVAKATDDYILAGNLSGLNIIAIVFVIIALSIWGGEYLHHLGLAIAGQRILYRMRTEMFSHLHRLSMAF
ncbi:MAG: hypothetical protein JSW16_07220, partial [Dehalococcoidales bacterium]